MDKIATMKPEVKIKFFAQNIGRECEFLVLGVSPFKSVINSVFINEEMVNHFGELNSCTVVKKDLTNISSEDAIQILKIICDEDGEYVLHEDSMASTTYRMWIVKELNDRLILQIYADGGIVLYRGLSMSNAVHLHLSSDSIFKTYQFLNEKGYALPWTTIEDDVVKTYSIKELIKNNLIKLK